MAVTINGTTGVSLVQDGVVVQADLAAGVAGNGPAFSAYLSANQSVTSSVWTKLTVNTEVFDTNNNFDSTTNYRFTPTVAGYYQINLSIAFGSGGATALSSQLYKNGVPYRRFDGYSATTNGLDDWATTGVALVSMNGSTDYLEVYGFVVSGTPAFAGGAVFTFFDGFLARAA